MLKSDAVRMKNRIDTIASFTEEPGRITRRTWSGAWTDCVRYVRGEMEKIGLSVRMDSFGNLIGRYDPAGSAEKPVGIGSHIDSVVNAGAYDGVAGVVCALEIVQMLADNRIVPPYPVEVLATAEEEGAVCQRGYFGARFMAGDMTVEELLSFRNIDGKNVADLRKQCPLFDGVPFGADNGWAKGYYRRFYEIHIEQGSALEKAGKQAGIVMGVVGIGRLFIDFTGESDHAGPTMMEERRDALAAAADFILQVRRTGFRHHGRAVTTVGRLINSPNVHNVIPGKVSLVVDFRAIEDETGMEILKELREYASGLARAYGVTATVTQEIYTPVKLFSGSLIREIRALEIPGSMDLYSWAGHDAKMFSELCDTAMVFLPSAAGKSHCPEEYTDIASLALACDHMVKLFQEKTDR